MSGKAVIVMKPKDVRDDSAHGSVVPMYEPKMADLPVLDEQLAVQASEDFSRKNVNLGEGKWYHAAYHLSTTIATPAAYAALPFAFAGLGWAGGIISLFFGWLVSCYNSYLLCTLQTVGGRKHVRYSSIAREVYGPTGYWLTIFFQQVASLGNNIAVEIAAGLAMKSIYLLYQPDGPMKLQHFIVIFACVEFLLSQLPDIHSLRSVNLVCTVCTVGFALTCLGLSIKNGHEMDRSSVTYEVLNMDRPAPVIFTLLASLGTVSFAFGDTVLPEIQATLVEPAIKEMQKAVFATYAIIAGTYFIVAVSGYWAFGYFVNIFLPVSFTGPTGALVLVNLFAIIQIAGCYQIYCRPTYEWASLRLEDSNQGPYAPRNVIVRFFITLVYSALMTLVACAIPFFGDFVALVGAIGFTPLDFILPVLLYNAANPQAKWYVKWLNLFFAFCYTIIAIVGFTGAVRWISIHIDTYSFFADL